GLATRHAEQAARFRPAQPDDALPAVVGLLRAELQHREGTLLPPPEGPEYTPCSSCTHIEPEHQPDAGPCLVCDCRAYGPAAVSAAVAPPTNHTALSDREKAMLSFALEIAQEEIHARSLDITDQDKAALVSLRRMADETATETPAPDDRRLHACTQFGTWFDRSICAEPCGAMHTRCTECGVALDTCPQQPAAGARQDGGQS